MRRHRSSRPLVWAGMALAAFAALAMTSSTELRAGDFVAAPSGTSGAGAGWNSVEGVQRAEAFAARRGHGPVHAFREGLAVSPDGALFASVTTDRPVNELDLIDPRMRKGWIIAHTERRFALQQPAFSPDGARIAFVVAVPSHTGEFTGLSAIWITDLQGGSPTIISAAGRLYRLPAFSPDGRRVAYFRDVLAAREEGMLNLPPENVGSKPMALFEFDLASGRETQVTARAFQPAGSLAYSHDGKGLYFHGIALEPRVHVSGSGVDWWYPPLGKAELEGASAVKLFHAPVAAGPSQASIVPSPGAPTPAGTFVTNVAGGLVFVGHSGEARDPASYRSWVKQVGTGPARTLLDLERQLFGSIGVSRTAEVVVIHHDGRIGDDLDKRQAAFIVKRAGAEPMFLKRADVTFADAPIKLGGTFNSSESSSR